MLHPSNGNFFFVNCSSVELSLHSVRSLRTNRPFLVRSLRTNRPFLVRSLRTNRPFGIAELSKLAMPGPLNFCKSREQLRYGDG